MSTILKALKKLEQEQEGTRSGHQYAGIDLNTRQVFHKAARFAWIKRVGLRWLLIFIGLSAGAAGLYFTGTGPKLFGKANLPGWRAAPDRTIPGEQISLKKEAPPPSSTLSHTDDSSTSGGSIPAIKEQPAPAPARQRPLSDAISPINPPARMGFKPPGEAFRNSDPIAAGPSAHTPLPSPPDAEPMTDGRLKVQAIAWSPVPEECMAVVNDRIVHQGDVVDGFLILAVEAEQIVVRSEGRTWTVAFGHGPSGSRPNPGSP